MDPTPKTLIGYIAQVSDNPEEVVQNLARAIPLIGGGFVMLSIYGYDDDPRPLHAIPAVRTWCQRFIFAGGLDYIPSLGEGPPGTDTDILKDFTIIAIAGLPGARFLPGKDTAEIDLDLVKAQRRKYSRAS